MHFVPLAAHSFTKKYGSRILRSRVRLSETGDGIPTRSFHPYSQFSQGHSRALAPPLSCGVARGRNAAPRHPSILYLHGPDNSGLFLARAWVG